MITETLAQIDNQVRGPKGWTAGVVLWDGVVVEAAPKVKYMAKQKWTRDRVRAFCVENGWKVTVVHQLTREGP